MRWMSITVVSTALLAACFTVLPAATDVAWAQGNDGFLIQIVPDGAERSRREKKTPLFSRNREQPAPRRVAPAPVPRRVAPAPPDRRVAPLSPYRQPPRYRPDQEPFGNLRAGNKQPFEPIPKKEPVQRPPKKVAAQKPAIAGGPKSPSPAILARLDREWEAKRAEARHDAFVANAKNAAKQLGKATIAFMAVPKQDSPLIFVDFNKTPTGIRLAEEARRQREKELLLQTLKDHVKQVALEECTLVEAKGMFNYRFIRRADLSKLDAYNVTYARRETGVFSFSLKSPGEDVVEFLQERDGKSISEHLDNEIVFRTSITDGMQAFVLKQRLQELINRCRLGDDYKARSHLPDVRDAVRMEGPMRLRRQ